MAPTLIKTMRLPAALLLATLASACAHQPEGFDPDADVLGLGRLSEEVPQQSATLEKRAIRALAEVEASSEERRAVLAAFDVLEAALRPLDAQLGELRGQSRALDVRAADFVGRSDALLAEQLRLKQQRGHAFSEFQHAAALAFADEKRWQQFSEAMSAPRFADGRFPGGGRRGGGGY